MQSDRNRMNMTSKRPQIAYLIAPVSTRAGQIPSSRNECAKAVEYAKRQKMTLRTIVAGQSAFGEVDNAFEILSQIGRAARDTGSPPPVLLITSIDRVTGHRCFEVIGRLLSLLEAGVEVHTLFEGRKYTMTMLQDSPERLTLELYLSLTECVSRTRTRSLIAKDAWKARKQKLANSRLAIGDRGRSSD